MTVFEIEIEQMGKAGIEVGGRVLVDRTDAFSMDPTP